MTESRSGSGARVANVVLGAWVLASAFEWPHTSAQGTVTAIIGALSIVAAAAALRIEGFRWVNLALGACLLVAALVLPHAALATAWNNAIAAIAMMLVSLLPNRAGAWTTTRPVPA